jgi:hypothetical protein
MAKLATTTRKLRGARRQKCGSQWSSTDGEENYRKSPKTKEVSQKLYMKRLQTKVFTKLKSTSKIAFWEQSKIKLLLNSSLIFHDFVCADSGLVLSLADELGQVSNGRLPMSVQQSLRDGRHAVGAFQLRLLDGRL